MAMLAHLYVLACQRFGWTPEQVAEIPDYLLTYMLQQADTGETEA